MLRTILSFCSILFLGIIGTFFFFIYSNLSMAQWEISGAKPIEINWNIPRLGVVLEYNNYSVVEDASEAPPVSTVVEEEVQTEEIYRDPDIVEIEKVAVGDDVNGKELIDHYGFPVPDMERIKTINLKNYVDSLHLERMLAEFDKRKLSEERVDDVVSMEKSSSKKEPLQEMVFIDYSKKQPAPLKPVTPSHSSNAPVLVSKVEPKLERAPPSLPPFLALATNFTKNKFFQRTLRVHSAVGGHHLDFQFIPDHDKEEIFYSDARNTVNIFPGKRLGEGILRGRVVSLDHIRTVVNLPISEEAGEFFDIPLIDEETFEKYRERDEDLYGGFLLVRLPKKVEDVDIDNDYSFRMFLDEEFRKVSQEDECSYILFMGIHPGVTVLSYLLGDGKVAEKPVHISVDEMLYDFSKVERVQYETFELFQKNLFSSEKQELALGEREISYFNRDIFPIKKGLNYYEIRKPPGLKGSRDYLKLSHLDGILYVGYRANPQLEVPSQDFVESILEGFDVDDLSNACLVQLNFSKPILNLGINLNTVQNFDNFDLIYLNTDGTFEEKPSLKTNKAFILGESPGVFSGGIEYVDNRQDFFKSFCSLGSYLIEQF